ncbi:MAG: glycosyltransferase family 9 protein [Chthoniobacterales bacterium]|nr:glycosyltransferase family 9 protein [Chthoniobacterales bacterium]
MRRILLIRGGAIGDFLLTLPALKALRDAFPNSHIEILGYPHIAALAERRFYAQAVRSLESVALSKFFLRNSDLTRELTTYFACFDLIISYLHDPDRIFESNLRRCGIENLVCGPGKIVETAGHAARQLAEPVEKLGIDVVDLTEKVFPSHEDRQIAAEFLATLSPPILAIHPGSGSAKKNWPMENWLALFSAESELWKLFSSLVVVSGEAEERVLSRLTNEWKDRNARWARNLPLPHLAAILERCAFVGHDSGISHLAAAAGAQCVLLFGPTNPEIWAPRNRNVRVLRARTGRLIDLSVASVQTAVAAALSQGSQSS